MSAVSIVIPTLNEEKYLPILLRSLSNLQLPLEIIVVDGGSTDRTLIVAEQSRQFFTHGEQLQIVPLQQKGVSLQRNTGVSRATNDIILFCDADILAPSLADFQIILTEFTQKELVLASCRIVPLEKNLVDSFTHSVAYLVQRWMLLFKKPYFAGGFLLTKKEVFTSLGGFNEDLRISEDVEYSMRAAKVGAYKLFNIPIQASTRRFQKYGYAWMWKNPKMLYTLLTKGRLTEKDKVFYPFGEY